jgi:hypothetical protein
MARKEIRTATTRKCPSCARATIRCRSCGRMTCKHYTSSVVDSGATEQDRRVTGLPKPPIGEWVGTCTACKIGRTGPTR